TSRRRRRWTTRRRGRWDGRRSRWRGAGWRWGRWRGWRSSGRSGRRGGGCTGWWSRTARRRGRGFWSCGRSARMCSRHSWHGTRDRTGGAVMSDEELDKMLGEMAVEDRAAVVAEAAAEREAEDQATAVAPAAGASPAGMVVADEGWGRPEREAEVEVDPAAAW